MTTQATANKFQMMWGTKPHKGYVIYDETGRVVFQSDSRADTVAERTRLNAGGAVACPDHARAQRLELVSLADYYESTEG